MANVQFKEWQCNDNEPAYTQEDALRKVLSFAGNHRVEARTVIPDPRDAFYWDTEQTGWTKFASSYTNQWGDTGFAGGVQGIGAATNQWYKIISLADVDYGFVADFDCNRPGGFLFGAKHDNPSGYLVWWSATQAGLSRLSGSGGYTETAVITLPNDQVCPAHVRVMVKPVMATAVDAVDDFAISLFFDDRVIFSYAIQYDTTLGKRIGFAVKADQSSNPVQFSNIVVQQFHQLLEIVYVGPTEQAGSALSRIVGMDKMRVQARYNGAVKLWRNDVSATDVQLNSSEIKQITVTEDLYAPTHFQLVGGMYQADVLAGYDTIIGTEQWRGHLLATANDPNSLTEMETFSRARRKAIEAIEATDSLDLVLRFDPRLEAEDVIGVVFPYATDPVKYRITSIDFQAVWTDNGVRYESTLHCRRLIDAF